MELSGLCNYVYETPCGGKMTGQVARMAETGVVVICPGAALGGEARIIEGAAGEWRVFEADEESGLLAATDADMREWFNARKGWSVVPVGSAELQAQVAADTCEEHGQFLCRECFDFGDDDA